MSPDQIKVLAFVLRDTEDKEITCFFCGSQDCDLEFTYRQKGRLCVSGMHDACGKIHQLGGAKI